MTNRQRDVLLRSAMADLRKTTTGYRQNPTGVNWRRAFAKLDRLQRDLGRPPVPQLGPIVADGLALSLLAPTHITDGLGWPAVDHAFGQTGRWVVAPELMTVNRQSSAQGGDAFYALGASGLAHWVGHIDKAPANGTVIRKGARVARIAAIARPHVHWAVDARALIGRHLLWGANGNGPPYTYGAPTIGAQLTRALEA